MLIWKLPHEKWCAPLETSNDGRSPKLGKLFSNHTRLNIPPIKLLFLSNEALKNLLPRLKSESNFHFRWLAAGGFHPPMALSPSSSSPPRCCFPSSPYPRLSAAHFVSFHSNKLASKPKLSPLAPLASPLLSGCAKSRPGAPPQRRSGRFGIWVYRIPYQNLKFSVPSSEISDFCLFIKKWSIWVLSNGY